MSNLIERIVQPAKSDACDASVTRENDQASLLCRGDKEGYNKSDACDALFLPSIGTDSIPGKCYIGTSVTSVTFADSEIVKESNSNGLQEKNGGFPSVTTSVTLIDRLFQWSARHNPDHLKMLEAISESRSEEFTFRCAGQVFRRRAAVDLPWLWWTLGTETAAVMELCEHITPGDKRVCGQWPPGGGLRHHWREWVSALASVGEIPAPELRRHHALRARARLAARADAAFGLANYATKAQR